jgi:peroxiredoxin Q/BCP
VDDNAAFAKKFQIPFPLLCDTNREIGLAYGACDSAKEEYAKRISYIIDPSGKIQRVFPKVNPSKHPEELLAVL